jgi:hypothetical protein
MRVFAICLTLAATAFAGCSAPTVQESDITSATPVPAVAAPPAAQAEPQPPSTQASMTDAVRADDSEVVCRKEKLLGTRIGKRVCKTREQFRLEEESARQMMKNRDQKGNNGKDPLMGTG